MKEIKNRVKESSLISFEVSSLMPKKEIIELDIKDQLWQGLVLKERDYRHWIKTHNWEKYIGKAIFIHCSSDAIIPSWAYLLILSSLSHHTSDCILGKKENLLKYLIKKNINALDLEPYIDKRVMLKGCSDGVEIDYALFEITRSFLPIVKSLMFGEACSNVPLYKKKN